MPPDGSPHEDDLFQPGQVLCDTYEVRSLLGEGAMGQVFEALDLKLQRKVAVKVAWPDTAVAAIRHEARALAALRHPGLVTVHAIHQHAEHELVVMDLIQGTTLEEELARCRRAGEPLPIARVLRLLGEIADALGAVHGAGLVHRDLKPANVMLTGAERVVLLDFGLFLPQFEPGRQERIVGSPTYMAPELIRNKVESGGWPLVDIYALGVLAFEMLAGEPPFVDESIREVFRMHVRKEVPDLTERRADIPPALAALVRELLAKVPSERPQSTELVVGCLRRLGERLARQAARGPFVVMIASPRRAWARTLAAELRRAVPELEARVAPDGEAAMQEAEERPPMLALIDGELGVGEALELAMYLRGSAPGCVVGLVGGRAGEREVELLGRLGVAPVAEHELTKLLVQARRS